MSSLPPGHGELPAWSVGELDPPPPFSFKTAFKVIGPGAIMAATSIGGGEWLVGPAAAVKYGTQLFLIATIAIVLQVIFNLEAIRYTLYTGEPILAGIMRLKPGPRFWAGSYGVLGFLQLVTAAASTQLVAALTGRTPLPLALVLLVLCLVALLALRPISRIDLSRGTAQAEPVGEPAASEPTR